MSNVKDEPLREALMEAFRHFDAATTSEKERESILISMTNHLDSVEAETAARAMFHRQKAREQQLELKALLEGIGKPAASATHDPR